MRKTIRFAWGTSSFGNFVLAMSDDGIVALEFSSSDRSAALDALRGRFPEADIIDGQQDLSYVLDRARRAIEEPYF